MLCAPSVFGSSSFFFKQKTAYEMRISDWSSDVCSSDLRRLSPALAGDARRALRRVVALGPRIPALQLRFSVPSHCIMAQRHRARVGRFKPRSGGTDIQILMFLALTFALRVLCGLSALRSSRVPASLPLHEPLQ